MPTTDSRGRLSETRNVIGIDCPHLCAALNDGDFVLGQFEEFVHIFAVELINQTYEGS